MSSIVEIHPATTSVSCDAEGSAQHVVNVHNTSGKRLRVGARVSVDAPAEAAWIKEVVLPGKEQQNEWDLDPDETIQLNVPIEAKGAPAGKYTMRVEVYSTEAPSEDYSTSDGIGFEVPEQTPEPTTPSKPFPWWIIAVIVGVLVLGGVGWWVVAEFVMKTKVPDLIGQPRAKAETMISEAGLHLGKVRSELSDEFPEGTVFQQKPEKGEKVKKDSAVNIVLAAASPQPEPEPEPEPQAPAIRKQGNLSIRQTFSADLDNGAETSNGADFWFQAETATRRFLVPKNGASLKVMGRQQVGYQGCSTASLSSARIDVSSLTAGTFVCVRTNEGRISVFNMRSAVGPSPGTLQISYTTWERRGGIVIIPDREVLQPVPQSPAVKKQGSLSIRQTFSADLDSGTEGRSGADFWFQAETATRRFLVPKNGATLKVMGRQSVGYQECSRAPLATTRVNIGSLPAGTFVCVKTNEGRFSVFRVRSAVGPSPGTLQISYTTWERRRLLIPTPLNRAVQPRVLADPDRSQRLGTSNGAFH